MLTEEEKEQALEKILDCGWAYKREVQRNGSVSYKYSAGHGIFAYIDGCRASVWDGEAGVTMFSREFDEKDFFKALARAARCADRLRSAYIDIERDLAGL